MASPPHPLWEAAAATGNIKQAPQDTSQLLPASAIEQLGSAETRVSQLLLFWNCS